MYCYVVKWSVICLQRGSAKSPIAPSNFSPLWGSVTAGDHCNWKSNLLAFGGAVVVLILEPIIGVLLVGLLVLLLVVLWVVLCVAVCCSVGVVVLLIGGQLDPQLPQLPFICFPELSTLVEHQKGSSSNEMQLWTMNLKKTQVTNWKKTQVNWKKNQVCRNWNFSKVWKRP